MTSPAPLLGVLVVLFSSACSQEPPPTAPTPIVATPSTTPPVTPPAVGMLAISMPIDLVDISSAVFGLLPYGYHGLDHAVNGHPGWDIESRVGGIVRAAADGQVQVILADASAPGRTTVKIEHILSAHVYTTVYSNLASVTSDVIEGALVRRGQPLGVAGSMTTTIGAVLVTHATTHFQVDDFEYYREIPDPNAVSPEAFLTTEGRLVFDRLWSASWFVHELTEPFASNPRAATFPLRRTWRRESGAGPMGITFTRRSPRNTDYEYELLAESGTVVETGRVILQFARPLATIDLVAPTAVRLGVYDIVDDRLRLAIGNPGGARPADLGAAALYRTPRTP